MNILECCKFWFDYRFHWNWNKTFGMNFTKINGSRLQSNREKVILFFWFLGGYKNHFVYRRYRLTDEEKWYFEFLRRLSGGRPPKNPLFTKYSGDKNFFLNVIEDGFPSLDTYLFWVGQRHDRPLEGFKYNFSSILTIFRSNTAL